MSEQDNNSREITVYRGVPSTSFPELLTDTTWRTDWEGGEKEARWVVPEDEQPFMEIGVVDFDAIIDPNWVEGLVTIEDPTTVDVRHLVAVRAFDGTL